MLSKLVRPTASNADSTRLQGHILPVPLTTPSTSSQASSASSQPLTKKARVTPSTPSQASSALQPNAESVRAVASDFFLNNKLSAKDVSRMVRGAHTSGAEGVQDLAKFHLPKNLARDLLNTLLKGTAIPELFHYSIRSWDPDTQEQVMADLPFLLPHELLHSMKIKCLQ